MSPPNFLDWRAGASSFESMGAYLAASLPVNLSGHGTPRRLDSTLVDVELFRTIGVQQVAGRGFTAEDGGADGARAVLLRHTLALSLVLTGSLLPAARAAAIDPASATRTE